jgi:hypothetical protein
MTRFTVRVELHAASYSDYETLHVAMERRGFSRTITSDDGRTYQLPTAEYDKKGSFTPQQILDSGKAGAAETGKTFAVFVTQAESRIWVGLQEIQAQVSSFRR